MNARNIIPNLKSIKQETKENELSILFIFKHALYVKYSRHAKETNIYRTAKQPQYFNLSETPVQFLHKKGKAYLFEIH